jgi:hypothetical protein
MATKLKFKEHPPPESTVLANIFHFFTTLNSQAPSKTEKAKNTFFVSKTL